MGGIFTAIAVCSPTISLGISPGLLFGTSTSTHTLSLAADPSLFVSSSPRCILRWRVLSDIPRVSAAARLLSRCTVITRSLLPHWYRTLSHIIPCRRPQVLLCRVRIVANPRPGGGSGWAKGFRHAKPLQKPRVNRFQRGQGVYARVRTEEATRAMCVGDLILCTDTSVCLAKPNPPKEGVGLAS